MRYFYLSDQGREGPVPEYDVAALIRDGKIQADTKVWRQGLPEWVVAEEMPEWEGRFAQAQESPEWTDDESPGSFSWEMKQETTEAGERTAVELPPTIPMDLLRNAAELTVRPWRRIAARFFDLIWWMTLIVFLLRMTLQNDQQVLAWVLSPYFNFASYALYSLAEAMMLSSWGTTPGKALLCIRVEQPDGQPPAAGKSLVRSFFALVRGMALGVPILLPLTLFLLFRDWRDTGRAYWDQVTGLEVRHYRMKEWRPFVYAGILLLLAGSWSQMIDPDALKKYMDALAAERR